MHFSLITLQLFFRVFKSTRKAGVLRSYMLPILVTTFFTVAIGQAQQTAPLGVDHKMTDRVKKKSQKRPNKKWKNSCSVKRTEETWFHLSKISSMNKLHYETVV